MNVEMDFNIISSAPVKSLTYYPASLANTYNNVEEYFNESIVENSQISSAPRQKINARERCRTFNVNAAYKALISLIPTEPVNRKLSKIEIIRLAKSYITHLDCTLHTGTDRQPCLLYRREIKNEDRDIVIAERLSICTFCFTQNCSNLY